jgi:CubicO group peptidase (beta-lactamase class C family)
VHQAELQAALDEACRKHRVPGASAAILDDGRVHLAASGVANVTTGLEVTHDTLMHIGSITKVINATLLMQLVEAGTVSLDHPVLDYLSTFRVRDPEATRAITVEMLVNHTSGIDGDLLPDLGHDAETIERTFERFADVDQIHDPGHGRSYCNPGTVIAGFLSQYLTGTSWYDLIKERIFSQLGMDHAAVLPEDALLYRTSTGHFLDSSTGECRRTSHEFLPLGYAPAGATAMMSANDLMTFIRAHLADGAAPNGHRIISEDAAVRMRRRSGPLDGPEAFPNGLGWRLSGDFVLHGGGGPGIVALAIAHVPSKSAAVVLTNAEHGLTVIADVIGPFFKARVGVDTFPPLPLPTGEPVDAALYTGVYRSINTVHEVEERGGALMWSSYSTQKYYDSSPLDRPDPTPLVAVGGHRFVADSRVSTMPASDTALISFVQPDERGEMKYLMESLWLFPRSREAGPAEARLVS